MEEEKKEENKNEIIEISKTKNNIINIGKYLEEKKEKIPEPNEQDLYYFFFKKEIYNEKGTKLLNKENFISLIKTLDDYIKEKTDFIFLYFKKIDIDIIKVLFNGYISYDISESISDKDLLETMKNIIPLFFSKNLFYIIYNKLSKIFRRFNLIENKEILFNNFCKIFELWKLIYDVNDKIKVNSNYFSFIGKKNLFIMNQGNNDGIFIFKEINIEIFFGDNDNSFFDEIKNDEIIKVFYNEYGSKVIKYKDIKFDENKEKIKSILFKIDEESINYELNKEYKSDSSINNEKFIQFIKLDSSSNFGQIELLKNYIGKINKIKINIEFKDEQIQNYRYEINPEENDESFIINSFETKKNLIKLSFEMEDKIKLISNKTYNDILYEDLRYYGGMESFIPLIKIIKYFISFFKDDENKINELSLILSEIMGNIFKFICYSKNNYKNFIKIISSLLGALAEINHAYPKDKINILYSKSIFSLFYIIIISSSLPFAIKKTYMKITGIYNDDKLNLNFDDLIVDVNKLDISSYTWYSIILLIIFEYILLRFNDINKIPKNIIKQLNNLKTSTDKISNKDLEQVKIKTSSYINCCLQSLNFIINKSKGDNTLFENCDKIENICEFFKLNFINNVDNIIFPLAVIKNHLNIMNLKESPYKFPEEKKDFNIENKDEIKNNYMQNFEKFFETFEKCPIESDVMKNLIIIVFKDYISNVAYLEKKFPFLSKRNLKQKEEIYFSELVDFHGDYHKLMKNLFIFNKLWSDKKLFFEQDKKEKYLKYKSINYYTNNYERPFVFPDLDYKNSYPSFSNYKIKNDFYVKEENQDEYNFVLDCPELDEFNLSYEEEILKIIKKTEHHEVCMVKRTHHIKGILFACFDIQGRFKKFLFYSYPETKADSKPFCNASEKKAENFNLKNEKICFGAIFKCPKKYMNRKIIFDIKDIKLVLRKIYFYRKTAFEIYTQNKSYFFNYNYNYKKNTEEAEGAQNLFVNRFCYCEFAQIRIKDELLGIVKNPNSSNEINKDNEDVSKNADKFISTLFAKWSSFNSDEQLSTLDLLIYLNLLSNRSYIDLFQYPVFPLMFFYDKLKENEFNLVDRKLSLHIGFQTVTERAKNRRNLFLKSFNTSSVDEEEEAEEEISYFQTHYSNNFYVNNFLVRLFPYSFISIELQGNGFDSPNRLFFSIEDSFFNISYHKSDIRELIPDLYYFPEVFWNLNKIDFHKRQNGAQVDDVLMPQDMSKIDKDKKDRSSVNLNDEYESRDYFRTFKFIEKMRNLLESKQTDIISWINIIFGPGQKYKTKNKDLYFKNESYIDYTDETKEKLHENRNNKNMLTNVEFGVTPIQIVFEGDIGKNKNKNNPYNLTVRENKEKFKKICKDYIDLIKPPKLSTSRRDSANKEEMNTIDYKNINNLYKITNSNNSIENYFDLNNISPINNIFLNPEKYIKYIYQNDKIKIVGFKTGKIEIFKKNENSQLELISELFDHKNEIIHIHYNERLNMICSTSKDGYINVYSFPNKLITTIKNPNNSFFDLVFLCSNPFPALVALEKENMNLYSFTINGFRIKNANIFSVLELEHNEQRELYTIPNFNEKGGTFKDRLIFIEHEIITTPIEKEKKEKEKEKKKEKEKEYLFKCYFVRVPFFEKEEKVIEIKQK